MPGEINGEIQNAQPEIHQETQVKKEGEVNKTNEVEKDVKETENGVHKETESDNVIKPPEPTEETNGNGTHHEENSNPDPEIPEKIIENQPSNEEKTENKVEEQEPTVESKQEVVETVEIENNVELSEQTVESKEEAIEENLEQTPEEKPQECPVTDSAVSQNEEPVSENLVCVTPVEFIEKPVEVFQKPVEVEEPVVKEFEPPKEELVVAPLPAVEITLAETAPVEEKVLVEEKSVEEKMTIENYAQKIESEKHKEVEKEYTKEVIESEVPARIVEEVKKGFESGARSNLRGHSDQAHQNGVPKKGSMFTSVDESSVKSAYEDVRNDSSETQWAVFKFEGAKIKCSASGSSFDTFQQQFDDKERAFGFIRVQTGDELSKRQKFLFITWVGPSVSVLQRAKMSTDKSFIKKIISNFAVELQLENQSEIDLKHFVNELNKAGGAHYGTGVRDN